MDRRYTQARFYNGERASGGPTARGEALARSYLAEARRINANAQSFGGSTGGYKSMDGAPGLNTLLARNEIIKDEREVFRQYGSGELGGRSSLAEVRGYR
jgi:hypothetical protein